MSKYTSLMLPLADFFNSRCYSHWLVRAEIVHDIAPHLASVATFAVHENVDAYALERRYRVSCVEVGGKVDGSDGATKKESIAKAKQILLNKSVDHVLAAYSRIGDNS